ncbi:MAG: hypothetical protein U0234_00995 [Sandaracinus sp.]
MTWSFRLLVSSALLAALALVSAGCAGGGDGRAVRPDTGATDAGPMDASRDAATDAGMQCMTNADCPDDHIFCNGVLQCMSGRCLAANLPSCNDSISCTDDVCDTTLDRCINTLNDRNCGPGLHCARSGCQTGVPCEFDSDCDDHVYCNGAESCVTGECTSAGARDCDDHMSCTDDVCDESQDMCTHTSFPDPSTNVDHCGDGTMCIPCPVPAPSLHQVATCVAGACGVACLLGYFDGDGDPANGCEYMCTPTGTGIDDPDVVGDSDCDGFEGTVSDGVFVSAGGLDSNPGTRQLPLHTISAGIGLAQSSGRHAVFVSEGTYNESVTLANGISIYGGYSMSHAWERNGSYITRISTSSVSSGRLIGVLGRNITTATRLSQLEVTTGAATAVGVSNYGLYCDTCTALTVRACTISAGAGGPGRDGTDGSDGGSGSDGTVGGGSSCDTNTTGALGGPGGASACGRTGGRGGQGGGYGANPGMMGGSGAGGTMGGSPGGGGNPGRMGGMGGTGASGGAGSDGTGGNGGSTSTRYWVSTAGGSGGTGGNGNGGGGGGGGGGQGCLTCDDGPGNGGGGGGGGGCGGGLGTGGGGGGGSFGLFLVDSTGIVLLGNTISSGNGGGGGRGGRGGMGGPPGNGVSGGTVCTGEVGAGGPGGNGGRGGDGGDGGGGAGGPSYGVYRLNTAVDPSGNSLANGSGGTGGTSFGSRGGDGAAATVF